VAPIHLSIGRTVVAVPPSFLARRCQCIQQLKRIGSTTLPIASPITPSPFGPSTRWPADSAVMPLYLDLKIDIPVTNVSGHPSRNWI
jgi:hypothetical protein